MKRLAILLFMSVVVGVALCAEVDESAPAVVFPQSNADQVSSLDRDNSQEGANVDLDQSATQYRAERSANYGGGYYGGGTGYGGYGYNRGYYGSGYGGGYGGGYPYNGGGYHQRGYYGGGYPGYYGYQGSYGHQGGYYGHHRGGYYY